MPDAYGQETPQEVQARIRQQFRDTNTIVQNSAAWQSPGVQAGNALSMIFGGTIRAGLETRSARKSEAQRLAETGVSMEEARQMAKQNIPFGTDELRKAKRIQTITKEASAQQEAAISAGENAVYAQADATLILASRLRQQGFHSEATAMTTQAMELRNAEEKRIAEMENLKARTFASNAAGQSSLAGAEQAGQTTFTKLVRAREIVQAQLDTTDDPDTIRMLERMLGRYDAKIDKEVTITGTTEHDPSNLSTAGRNKQATEIIEGKVLSDALGHLENKLVKLDGDFAASYFGNMSARALGAAEQYLGRELTQSDQEFIDEVMSKQGGAALIAADIRHSLTGAAMSPAEAVFLEPFLPLPSDSRGVMLSKVRLLKEYTNLDVETRQTMLDMDKDEAAIRMGQLGAMAESVRKAVPTTPAAASPNVPAALPVDDSVSAALEIMNRGKP